MINLLIDTCTSNMVIALIKDEQVLNIFNQKLSTDLSTKVFPVMQDIFNKVGISHSDVDNIFVANGPGSFTGIRIGVTIAKTYAWALNKRIVPISSLELIATTSTNTELIVPIIDARRDYVYAGIYNDNLDVIMEDTYISMNELNKKLEDKDFTFVSYDNFDNIAVTNPDIDVTKIINKHESDKSLNPHFVNPNYLKLTEAEMNLNKNV